MLKMTIITVCYNEKESLEKTIESVCSQTYPEIEYLVIDGASTDGTADMVKKWQKAGRLQLFSEKDYGIYNAMNRGIARAGGDYVYFINAGDTLCGAQVISDVVSYIREDRDSIYYGRACRIFLDGFRQIEDFSKDSGGTLEKDFFQGGMPCHQSIFAPRKMLTDHYFMERYQIRADYEWLLFCLGMGCRCRAIPVTVANYDMSGTSGRLKNRDLFLQEEREIIERYRNHEKREAVFDDREIERAKKEAEKYALLFRIMSLWMSLRQGGRSVGEYLQGKGYRRIAVYGMGHMGHRLLQDLEGWDVEVDYAVDRDAGNLPADIRVVSPEDVLEEVDAVVVTAVGSFWEIRSLLTERLGCPILSLEDVLYEMGG